MKTSVQLQSVVSLIQMCTRGYMTCILVYTQSLLATDTASDLPVMQASFRFVAPTCCSKSVHWSSRSKLATTFYVWCRTLFQRPFPSGHAS